MALMMVLTKGQKNGHQGGRNAELVVQRSSDTG
jgi:hypothetical protein